MKKRIFFCFIVFSNLFLWVSCGPAVDEGFLSEGVITYDAEVIDTENSMADLAPTKMLYKFKDNKSCAEMSAGMGMLTLSFISDPETQTFTQLVRLVSQKYCVIQNITEIKKENELFNLEVIPTKETKIIAGYKCFKARVHYKGGDPADYDVYYTKGLDIKNPNFASPYFMLDGVIMEFKMKKVGIEMKFTAKSVTKESIDNSIFERPSEYKQISAEKMTEMFKEYQ